MPLVHHVRASTVSASSYQNLMGMLSIPVTVHCIAPIRNSEYILIHEELNTDNYYYCRVKLRKLGHQGVASETLLAVCGVDISICVCNA